MESIRLLKSVPIEVNDEGENIVLNVGDQQFVEKFYGLFEKMDDVKKELHSPGVNQKSDREQLKLMIERTKEVMSEIDNVFGPESCRKVFGDIVPNPYLIGEFLDQVVPIAERYFDDRQKEIAKKYSSNRKGARTSKYRTKEEIIQDAMR